MDLDQFWTIPRSSLTLVFPSAALLLLLCRVFQRGLDSDGKVPPPPTMKAPTMASAPLPDSEGYCSHGEKLGCNLGFVSEHEINLCKIWGNPAAGGHANVKTGVSIKLC